MRARRLALLGLCLLICERSISFAQTEAVSTLREAAGAVGSKRPDEDRVLGAVLRVQKEKAERNKASWT